MERLPPLPKPLALHRAAPIDDDLYTVGGCEMPDDHLYTFFLCVSDDNGDRNVHDTD